MKMRVVAGLAAFLASAVCVPVAGLAQEREWSLDATDKEAFLVFGVPDTDDVGLSVWCSIGSGKAALYLPLTTPLLKSGERADMKVAVDGKTFHLKAKAFKDSADAKMTVEGDFKLDDRLMAALKEGQGLAITIKNRTNTFPLTDADFDGLVNACKGVAPDSSDN